MISPRRSFLYYVFAAVIGGCLASIPWFMFYSTPQTVFVKDFGTEWRPLDHSEQCKGVEPVSTLEITGVSMLPTLKSGDKVLTIPYNSSRKLAQGEIVYINNSRAQYVHRVYGVYTSYFITRGDNNIAFDVEKHGYDDIEQIICGVLYS